MLYFQWTVNVYFRNKYTIENYYDINISTSF